MRTLSAPTPYHQQQPAVHNGGNRNSLATFNATTEQHHQHYHNLTNLHCRNNVVATSTPKTTAMNPEAETIPSTTAMVLKIEETAPIVSPAAATVLATSSGHRRPAMAMTTLNGCVAAATQENDEESLKNGRQRQLENDMETMFGNNVATTHWTHRENPSQSHQPPAKQLCNGDKSGNSGFNNCGDLAAMLAIPKRERINHAAITTPTSAISTAKLGNTVLLPSTLLTSSPSKNNGGGTTASSLSNGNDVTKKGSTSTIWTSEESILRSVGAVDEDNK